jgi:Mrp family chromosome partitioning ATPase
MLMRQMGLLTRDQLWRVLEHLRWNPLAPSDDAIQIASRLRARHTEKANVIVVSACAEGDGASIAAAQIAAALALMDAGSVLLVDANLRNATLHTWFSAPLVPGLTDLIQGTSSAGVQPAPGASGLRLLPAGNLAVDAVSLLMSERCVATLESLRRVYDWIILDAPPMLLHPDAVVLASRANGVVAVVAAGRGRKSELREMQRVAEGVGVGLSGVVVTEQTQRFSQRRLPWLGALRRRP